ncbi:MAG: hypothetical protein LBO69_05950 [Ignavibacteria bacterium]|jgi:shikimate dehydrogenase|nr:hypothetical protein [Ignavibacteria bacterium]
MKYYAVCGSPILHSLSPQIFQQLFATNNYDSCYTRLLCDNADDAIILYKALNLSGMNITAPLKHNIMHHCNSCTGDAKRIDAINTIVTYRNQLLGFNTDWEGVLNTLRLADIDIQSKKILVIGAGNSAASAIFGIIQFFPNADITITNRSEKNGMALANKFNLHYTPLDADLQQYSLIINTIPQPELVNLNFHKEATILFANYTSHSYFSKISSKYNIIIGLQWLINQAIPAFEYFISNDDYCKKVDLSNEIINEYYTKCNNGNIYLTGFSGSGKSYIGERIAKNLHLEFVDTDELVVAQAGKSIPAIFADDGEQAFRNYETEVLTQVGRTNRRVVALGGGCLQSQHNVELAKRSGVVIYLYSELEGCLARIDKQSRPMLNATDKKIESLYNQRMDGYLVASDMVVASHSAEALLTSSFSIHL